MLYLYLFGHLSVANGDGPGVPLWLIGSADLMGRNIKRRVEALVPVEAPALQERLQEVLDVVLADDRLAWELSGDGCWTRLRHEGDGDGVDSHLRLQELALGRARRTPHDP